MAVNRYYSSTAVDTTLSSPIGTGDTSITVASTTGFPLSYPYTLAIGYDTSNEELVQIVAAAGNVLTIGVTVAGGASSAGRAQDGTTAKTHVAAETVKHVISGRDLREPQEHIAASSSVHGVTGSVVGTSDAQTLTNKTISGGAINASTLQVGGIAVVTESTSQTLTNKTLTSPTINGGAIDATTLKVGSVNAVTVSSTDTLTNKTLTSPKINENVALTASATELNVLDGIPTTLTATELGYVDGVTSAIQTQIDTKAPKADPTFTGTVTLPTGVTGATGAITSNMIKDGTIVAADIADGTITPAKLANTPYMLLSKSFITTAGSGTYTVPTGARALRVVCIGGGGAGGNIATSVGGAGGGGAGAYAEKWITGTLSSTYSVSVGAGGSAADGGATTFNTNVVVAQGGGYAGSNTSGAGGDGGNADSSTGDFKFAGQTGFSGGRDIGASDGLHYFAGAGGSTMYGAGGSSLAPASAQSNGVAATGYGSGGGGSRRSTSGSATGGAGASGVIIVEAYA